MSSGCSRDRDHLRGGTRAGRPRGRVGHRRHRPRARSDAPLPRHVDDPPWRRRPPRRAAAPEPGQPRQDVSQPVVRGDDGARAGGVRRLGRVRPHGHQLVDPRRVRLPHPGLGMAMGGGVLVDDDRRRHRRRRHLPGDGLRAVVGVPLSPPLPRHRVARTATALFALSVLLGRPLDLRVLLRRHRDRRRARARRPDARAGGTGWAARSASATSGRAGSRPTSRSRSPSSR